MSQRSISLSSITNSLKTHVTGKNILQMLKVINIVIKSLYDSGILIEEDTRGIEEQIIAGEVLKDLNQIADK